MSRLRDCRLRFDANTVRFGVIRAREGCTPGYQRPPLRGYRHEAGASAVGEGEWGGRTGPEHLDMRKRRTQQGLWELVEFQP
ncbi:MAG: hypothetical protein WD049_09640 [Candidatus Paceibacterota bacterium]